MIKERFMTQKSLLMFTVICVKTRNNIFQCGPNMTCHKVICQKVNKVKYYLHFICKEAHRFFQKYLIVLHTVII